MARLAPTIGVVRRLFALSGNNCAFPGCFSELVDEDNIFVGQICHIEAASTGGQRNNSDQDDEDRRSFENLLLLCYPHHKKTDNVALYTVKTLRDMKRDHEMRFKNNPYNLPKEAEEGILEEISKKLDEIHSKILDVEKLAKDGNEQIGEISNTNKEILSLLRGLGGIPAINPSKIVVDESKIYSEQLEFIKRLRTNRKTVTALEELERLKEEKWEGFDQELRYKFTAHIAGALLDLGRTSEAGQHLLTLEHIQYRTSDSLAYLALGYSITKNKDKFDQIFKDPLMAQSDSSNFWIAYVNLYKSLVPPRDIEALIPQTVIETPEVCLALADAFFDSSDEKTSVELLDKALAGLSSDIDKRWRLQGIIATQKLQIIAAMGKIAFKAFNPAEKIQITELIELLSESWNYISKTEIAASSWYLVLNRGVAYRAVDKKDLAEKDFETAWELSRNFAVYKNLILQYLDTEQYGKAHQLMEDPDVENLSGFKSIDYAALVARLSFLTEDSEAAFQILNKELLKSEGEERRFLLDLIIVGYFEIGDFQTAMPLVEQLIDEFPNSPHGYLAKGTYLRKLEKVKVAEEHMQTAMRLMNSHGGPEWIWYLLGEEFYLLKNLSSAIICLKKVYRPGLNNDIARRLILANFYQGNYEEAESLSLNLRSVSDKDIFANEVLFKIYETSGRNTDAANVIEQYLSSGKKRGLDHFKLLGIKFYHSKHDLDNLRRLLSEIKDFASYPLRERFILSQLHIIYGDILKGLEIAFETRVENFEIAKAHECYVNLLFRGKHEPKDQMFPERVDHYTAVELIDGASTVSTYLIIEDERITGANILRPSDPLSILLFGKKVGDTILLNGSVGVGSELTVSSIMSKYTFAFRESLKLLETKYAGQSEIVFFHDSKERPNEQLLEYVQRSSSARDKREEEIIRIYNSGRATLGMIAHYFGENIVETWLKIIAETSTGIYCYETNELPGLSWTLLNQRPVVIETTALLTLFGLLNSKVEFQLLDTQFYIAQATLDDLIAHRYALEVLHTEITEEESVSNDLFRYAEIGSQKVWLDKLISWCNTNTTQIIPKATISTDEESRDMEEMIGRAAYHSLELSNQLGGTLLSDDARLKSLAMSEYGTKSFSSYQVVIQFMKDGALSKTEFSNISKLFICSNYLYIPISMQELWSFYEDTTFQIKPPFTYAIRGLNILSAQATADLIASFGKEMYLSTFPLSIRDNVLQLLLRTVKRRIDYENVKSEILKQADSKFFLLPQYRDNFKNLILSI